MRCHETLNQDQFHELLIDRSAVGIYSPPYGKINRLPVELRNHMPVTGRERIFLEHFWQTLSLRAYF